MTIWLKGTLLCHVCRPMFTMYSCCSNQGIGFWPLMSALFGYQDDPSPLEW